ncbi:MAG: hypothetical protein ABR615_06965 [Pseudonocardiaceae bacterium]
MTKVRHARRADPLHLLCGSLHALTMLGIAGTAFELATLRHWNGAMQLVPWAALLVLAAALALHAGPVGRAPQTGLVRSLALLVLAASMFGVMEHVLVNYDAGPLDQHFADTWDMLSPWLRWWYAVTRTVGPAPTLAPGMLGQAATTLILATIGQRATSTPSATRHRGHSYLSRLPEITCARADAMVVATAVAAPRQPGGHPRTRHRRHTGDAVEAAPSSRR